MDGEEPHRVGSLLLGERLQLLRAERALIAHEAHEPAQVCAPHGLVLACEPAELPQVREAPGAVPARQNRQVVVVLGDDLLAELLQPETRGGTREPLVPLPKGAEKPPVVGADPLGHATLERGVERAPQRGAAHEHERVVRDADERRREHGRERDVVVAVLEQAEVREQVRDLLLAEVAASGRPVRGEAVPAERLLVALGVRPGGEEDDDLPREAAPDSTSSETRVAIARASPCRQCSPESR